MKFITGLFFLCAIFNHARAAERTFCNSAKKITKAPEHSEVADCGREMINYNSNQNYFYETANGHGDKSYGCQRMFEGTEELKNRFIEAKTYCSGIFTRMDARVEAVKKNGAALEDGYERAIIENRNIAESERGKCINMLQAVKESNDRAVEKLSGIVRTLEGGRSDEIETRFHLLKIQNATLKSNCLSKLKTAAHTNNDTKGFYRVILEIFKENQAAIAKDLLKYQKK